MEKCRTCLGSPANKDMSELEKSIKDETKKYTDIIAFCLDIKVTQTSKITTSLCNNCYRKIITFYKFKVLSLKNDEYLKSLNSVNLLEDQKALMHVDKVEINYEENPLETNEYEYCNTNIKIENERTFDIEIEVKGEETTDDQTDSKVQIKLENEMCDGEPLSIVEHNKHITNRKETKENAAKGKKRVGVKKLQLAVGEKVIPKKKVSCSVCSKLFIGEVNRDRHIKVAHLGVKSKCDICNKEVRHVASHMFNMHNPKSRRFGCEVCEHRFPSKALLNIHMVTHTKDRAFECDICHKTYPTKYALAAHLRSTHLQEKKFQCEICAKAFFYKSFLQEHLTIHSSERPFQCDKCDKTFKLKTSLKKHSIAHSDVRNYHCQLCDKSFKKNVDLSKHMVKHTKEQRFPCRYCEKRFCRSSTRFKHERRQHTGLLPSRPSIPDQQIETETKEGSASL